MDRLLFLEEDVPSVNLFRLAYPFSVVNENDNFMAGALGLGCDDRGKGNVRAQQRSGVPRTLSGVMHTDKGNLQQRSKPKIFRDMYGETTSKTPDSKPRDFRPASRENRQRPG